MPLVVAAQTTPEGAKVNEDKCLGYEMDYKKYPKPVIAKVQADMYQLYHLEEAWKIDAAGKGQPLSDGILGPITWSWMQRFCKSFALDKVNVLAAFPQRATQIATFSKTSNEDAVTLIGDPFAQWVATHSNACGLNVKQILAEGSDADLQKLLRCFRQPVAVPVPQEKAIKSSPLRHEIYVFRADDFEDMKNKVAITSQEKDAIDNITGKQYPDKIALQAELSALLVDLPPEKSKKIVDDISAKLQEKKRYEITDAVLNNLSQQPISDALFDELKKLMGKAFADQASFTKAIDIAIAESLTANPTQAPIVNASASETSASVSSVTNQAVPESPPVTQSTSKLVAQILFASEQTYVELDKATAAGMGSDKNPVADIVIKILTSMQDIEYPTSELIDLAIISKILKASDFCKLDESNTSDLKLDSLQTEEINLLLTEIENAVPADMKDFMQSNKNSQGKGKKMSCNENHNEALKTFYDQRLKHVLQLKYSEAMPPYTYDPILWKGGEEKCGCVRAQIQTVAYGIYPYWKWQVDKKKQPEAQIFDFSTFSRIAYFGLTANDYGTLEQINATSESTLLNTNGDGSKAFIKKARSYGGKMDWIIEKEFTRAPSLNNKKALDDFFNGLKQQVLTLLTAPLEDSESLLLPLLSFGLASQPTNGDGVTFYFKNYPDDASVKDSKAAFEKFFAELTDALASFDNDRNKFRAVKNHTYINIMITQSEFLDSKSAFFRDNLTQLIVKTKRKSSQKNETNSEVQDRIKSMIILMLEDPYYNALDTIYAVTDSTTRAFIAPLMFTDYSGLAEDSNTGAQNIDERKKRLSYIHESFGGGGFWPIIEYASKSNGKKYDVFNEYIGEKFSPGYAEGSWWDEHFCNHRWAIIAVMNFWLLLALTYVVSIFYIFPYHCKKLPGYIRWLEHPLTVVVVVLPVIVLWGYLLVEYPPLLSINIPNLLVLIILILVIWAAVNAFQKLNEPKPARNSSQYKNASMVPTRTPYAPDPVDENDEIDDTDVSDSNK